jgi:hypothetical protein
MIWMRNPEKIIVSAAIGNPMDVTVSKVISDLLMINKKLINTGNKYKVFSKKIKMNVLININKKTPIILYRLKSNGGVSL